MSALASRARSARSSPAVVARQPDLAVAEGRLVGQPQRQPEVDEDGVLRRAAAGSAPRVRRPGTAAACRRGRWSRRRARRPRSRPGRPRAAPRTPAAAPASRRARSRRTARRVRCSSTRSDRPGRSATPGRRRWARPAARRSATRNEPDQRLRGAGPVRRQRDGLEQRGVAVALSMSVPGWSTASGGQPAGPGGAAGAAARAAYGVPAGAGARRGRPAPSAPPSSSRAVSRSGDGDCTCCRSTVDLEPAGPQPHRRGQRRVQGLR